MLAHNTDNTAAESVDQSCSKGDRLLVQALQKTPRRMVRVILYIHNVHLLLVYSTAGVCAAVGCVSSMGFEIMYHWWSPVYRRGEFISDPLDYIPQVMLHPTGD